jgi:hypothetical protein
MALKKTTGATTGCRDPSRSKADLVQVAFGSHLSIGKAADKRYELPHSGKPDEDVHDPRKKGFPTAEDGCNQINVEQPDKAPIQAAYNDEQKRDDVQSLHFSLLTRAFDLHRTTRDQFRSLHGLSARAA